MKIAVCFFGITRNFSKYTLDSIERCLFAEVARVDPQFLRFAHFNRISGVTNKRSKENGVAVDAEDYKLLNCKIAEQTDQEIVDQQIDFDYIKKFGDVWRDDFNSLKNLLRQFYSLGAVTELLLQGGGQKCDLVIFTRADIRFETPVWIPRVPPAPRTLYTPWFDKYHGLNDRFAMGDVETMIAYGRRQSAIRQYCEQTGKPLSAEGYLRWFAANKKLRTRDLTSVNFSRVRAHGLVSPMDRSSRAKAKYYLKRGLQAIGLR